MTTHIPKIIKTEADYDTVLARIEEIFDARPGTMQGDELELLTLLVERYEEVNYPIELPTPVEAIRFRMEQMGLKQKDLASYFGGAAKVSEVLSGRRELSITMMRNLRDGLGIPAEVLLGKAGAQLEDEPAWAKQNFPFTEMFKRGWFAPFEGTLIQAKEKKEELLSAFFAPVSLPSATGTCALNRQNVRSQKPMNDCALAAWRVRVIAQAQSQNLPAYKPETVTPELLHKLVSLSYFDKGPLLAQEFLAKQGVPLIIERHLEKTYLDGAAICMPDGRPMVALTLRHDRLDNFWFTLLHELAHVMLHLDREDVDTFFDDLDKSGEDECEKQADKTARDALIPPAAFAAAELAATPESIRAFAEELHIHPAIVAGRARHELKDYSILGELIGSRQVRTLFENAGGVSQIQSVKLRQA